MCRLDSRKNDHVLPQLVRPRYMDTKLVSEICTKEIKNSVANSDNKSLTKLCVTKWERRRT
jgi:hypothetical protein